MKYQHLLLVSSFQFSLDTGEVINRLLGQLQVILQLPLGLLNIRADLLFTLKVVSELYYIWRTEHMHDLERQSSNG